MTRSEAPATRKLPENGYPQRLTPPRQSSTLPDDLLRTRIRSPWQAVLPHVASTYCRVRLQRPSVRAPHHSAWPYATNRDYSRHRAALVSALADAVR